MRAKYGPVTGLVYTQGKFNDLAMTFSSQGASADVASLWDYGVYVLTAMGRSGQLIPMTGLPTSGGVLPNEAETSKTLEAKAKELDLQAKALEQQSKDSEAKAKELEKKAKELEAKEKELAAKEKEAKEKAANQEHQPSRGFHYSLVLHSHPSPENQVRPPPDQKQVAPCPWSRIEISHRKLIKIGSWFQGPSGSGSAWAVKRLI